MSADYTATLRMLAAEEIETARIGGDIWRSFVLRAQMLTGLPWSQIREDIDPFVIRELAQREWLVVGAATGAAPE